MHREKPSEGRKNVGAILHRYYGLDGQSGTAKQEQGGVNGMVRSNEAKLNGGKEGESRIMWKSPKGGNQMCTEEPIDASDSEQLNQKSTDFNVSEYFKKMLQKASLKDLIQKAKNIEKEIKQNDNFMQSVVYENYNKFMKAADTIVNLKRNFGDVKDKIGDINEQLNCIDKNSHLVNNKIGKNYKKIRSLLQIKELLNGVHTIMSIPRRMFDLILLGDYTQSLQLFMEAVPFFHDNRSMRIFRDLYLDSENMASIACYYYEQELGRGITLSRSEHTQSGEQSTQSGKQPTHYDGNSAEDFFNHLCEQVTSNEEITSALYLILAYGKDKKEVRNVFLRNRLAAMKYLLCEISNWGSYIEDGATKEEEQDNGQSASTPNQSAKEKEPLRHPSESAPHDEGHNRVFKTVLELAYTKWLHFFFTMIRSYGQLFLLDFYCACDETRMERSGRLEALGGIPRLRALMRKLGEATVDARGKGGAGQASYNHTAANYNNDAANSGNAPDGVNPPPINWQEGHLEALLSTDDDREMMELLRKILFKLLQDLTVDLIYMLNPPVKLVALCVRVLQEGVRDEEGEEARKSTRNADNLSVNHGNTHLGSTHLGSNQRVSPLMDEFLKRINSELLKFHVYSLCLQNDRSLMRFFSLCKEKEASYILENKPELSHHILLSLCLVLIDLEAFYKEIPLTSTDFYFKNLINFVIIYFVFLVRFVDSFIRYFVCVFEGRRNDGGEGAKDDGSPFEEDPPVDKEQIFQCRNIYPPEAYYSDVDNADEEKKKKKKSTWKCTAKWIYQSVTFDGGEFQNVLMERKKLMKMDFDKFIESIIKKHRFEAEKKIEMNFLFTLVGILDNMKKEGVLKVCTVIVDMYKEAHTLVNQRKRISLRCTFEDLLYKDSYPFCKMREGEEGQKRNEDQADAYADEERHSKGLPCIKNGYLNGAAKTAYYTFQREDPLPGHDDQDDFDDHDNLDHHARELEHLPTQEGAETDEEGKLHSVLILRQEEKQHKMKSRGIGLGHSGEQNNAQDGDNLLLPKRSANFVASEGDEPGETGHAAILAPNGGEVERGGATRLVAEGGVTTGDAQQGGPRKGKPRKGEPSKGEPLSGEPPSEGTRSDEFRSDDDYDDNQDDTKNYTVGIRNFAKFKFLEKRNELMNAFLSYYLNKISRSVKEFLQREKWTEGKKTELVSKNFIYLLNNIIAVYSYLASFLESKATGAAATGAASASGERDHFNDVKGKIGEALDRVCKEYAKGRRGKTSSELQAGGGNHDVGRSYVSENRIDLGNTEQKETHHEKNLEMYMYKLYMCKMKNYRSNLHLENKKIILVIIKILFKNYSEYVRDLYFNEYGFEKLRVNFFFFFHCLKVFVPMDDEHVLFVILNEVLISAYERSTNFTPSSAGVNAIYQSFLLNEIDCDLGANRDFIMNSLRRA
ncbi:hypothetical protein C922_04264 [Plasmodium inui San Antonio 1]|uniref:t-SNARE coiled-coil homology domain-containing protein n=1 Tax=Plasmodium inui San Antonio 1 TaxID=1237626 RepID=W7AJ42_9APIC|nr:hypothetical protein C922_04264 [Plasmodium inui San Antonio 1]EUD65321.1 hypothetical protein C922_04264 [Plasmodium inui San Antonio 1]